MWRATGALGLALLGPWGTVAEPAPASVPEPSFSVRLSSGRSTYAIGERIPLDLEFGGEADGDFYWSTETYDRSGRMGAETYEVTPGDGFEDPLADYFQGGWPGGKRSGAARAASSTTGGSGSGPVPGPRVSRTR